jgi:hypothetical protein
MDARPLLVGNLNSPTDWSGKYVIRQIIKIGKGSGHGSIEYGDSRLPIGLRTHLT